MYNIKSYCIKSIANTHYLERCVEERRESTPGYNILQPRKSKMPAEAGRLSSPPKQGIQGFLSAIS